MAARLEAATGERYLALVTALCQRIRTDHPTAGVWEAADFQWWWRKPRPTDHLPQRFWLDTGGQPIAGGILTDWGDNVAVDILTMPDAVDVAEEVWTVTLADADDLGKPLEAMVDSADRAHIARLVDGGFVDTGDCGGSAWADAADLPTVTPAPSGYELVRRTDAPDGSTHHFAERNGPDVEHRLRSTSLYRADLDLTVVDHNGTVCGYGLFWYDPVTRTGFVEPMGTVEHHRRRGIARHILTVGLQALVEAGAQRIRINYDAGHEPSRSLYLESGFTPVMETELYLRT